MRWLRPYTGWWLRRPKTSFLLVLVLIPVLFVSVALLAGDVDAGMQGAFPGVNFTSRHQPKDEEAAERTTARAYQRIPEPIPLDATNEMSSRALQMRRKCSEFGLDQKGTKKYLKPNPWEYYINQKYHLVWCPIFKAGASSMLYSFLLLSGEVTEEDIEETLKKDKTMLPLARSLYPRPSVKDLAAATEEDGGSIVFLIVRDPFQRLYSAYQDKILNPFQGSPHDKMGKKMILDYRKLSTSERQALRSGTLDAKPSFEEFSRYLLAHTRRGDMDMHWMPYYQFCTPCQVHVNMILKIENLEREQRYLFEKIGASDLVRPRWENKGRLSKETREEDVAEVFSSLPGDVLQGLIEIYRKDFELFGYSIDKYRRTRDS
ncbi:unnamed protein product [Darwinula stevensoni]|uniref:Carbohydrate sulfotransferase n=1 Tax=Darwinula stevensoni TaxID=69355 RepID=A0A7R9ABH7_9CRUS|nr:unnamed protein product [Darwinula stevensoni]CAG0899240.1 unnamed protein product [Darwinula stevensoni]